MLTATMSATASAMPSCAGADRRSDNFRVVPPATGICHQVNLEYLSQVASPASATALRRRIRTRRRHRLAHDDGQRPRRARRASAGSRPRPRCSVSAAAAGGFELSVPEGATATDLVLTVTEMLRERGGLEVRRVRGPACPRSGSPTGRRSATRPRSSARPARSSRSTGRRCATASPAVRRTIELVRARAGDVPRRGLPGPHQRSSSSTWAASSPRSRASEAPQDRISRWRMQSGRSSSRWPSSTPTWPRPWATAATR